jgi:succinoglycan biosynthesis transport protein ExoP
MNEETVEYNYSPSAAKAHFGGRLRHYRDLVTRKWWVLALGAVLGVVAAAAVARFQPPTYTSAGQMIVNVKLMIPQGSVFTEELNNFLGTQAALMQSDIVANRAYGRLALTNLPPKPPRIKVSVSPKTSIFNLKASGPDPEVTRLFLQVSMEEYTRLKREMRKQTSDTTVADLSEEVLTVEKDVRKAQDEIAEFMGTNSMVWLEEQGNMVGNYLGGVNQRLEAMKSEHDLLETLTLDQNLQRQEAAVQPPPTATDNTGDTSNNGVVNNNSLAMDYLKARQQLLLMKAEQQDLGQYLRPKHPKMVAMTEDIARRERLLEIFKQQNVEQLEARKASVALQIQNLEKELKEWNVKIGEISRKSAEYGRLKSNAQRVQALYQQLLGTVQTLDANKEIGAETVSIMEPASPALLDSRKQIGSLVLAGLGCIFASVALLLFLDRLDDRVNSFSELQETFDEPVLVQIPREKPEGKKGHVKLIQPRDERHSFLESYRNLRSSLLYMAQSGKRPKTLLLTSSIPNEGKSLTVANLGITMANSGARVLVVDADLRKGLLHHRFGLEAESGLCEVLQEGARWQDLILTTPYKNLSLLPRGGVSTDSSELFLGSVMEAFLKDATAQYDFVLLDTAPIMAADDVTSLAPLMDAVLFLLRAEHTSARVAHAALDLLYQRNVRVLGIILNAVRPSSGDYSYYYKYKDYYTSYPSKDGKGRKPKSEPAAVEG